METGRQPNFPVLPLAPCVAMTAFIYKRVKDGLNLFKCSDLEHGVKNRDSSEIDVFVMISLHCYPRLARSILTVTMGVDASAAVSPGAARSCCS